MDFRCRLWVNQDRLLRMVSRQGDRNMVCCVEEGRGSIGQDAG